MPGGKIESESTNAYIYADDPTVLIYNAGTIDTNIIEISGGGQLYNATTGVIEATTIKTSGGGQQIGWDQAANKPILREEKIINESTTDPECGVFHKGEHKHEKSPCSDPGFGHGSVSGRLRRC